MKAISIIATILTLSPLCNAQQGWWMTEPIRWLQTNLADVDASLDLERFVNQVADFKANVLLIATGGISAFYPSRVAFHYVNPHMPKGHDTFGEVLQVAHKHKIRVVARFDVAKTRKSVFDAHPEWFNQERERTSGNLQPLIHCVREQRLVPGENVRDPDGSAGALRRVRSLFQPGMVQSQV